MLMNPFRSGAGLAFALLAAVGSFAPRDARASLLDDLPAGTGYAAWELCSRTLVSGDDFARVRDLYTAPKVPPLPWIWQIDAVPGQQVAVDTWLPFLANRRVGLYRPGLGCTLVMPGASEAQIRAQPFKPVAAVPSSNSPWPEGDGPAQTSGLSPARAALLAKYDQLVLVTNPAGATAQQQIHTIALLVAQDGKLLHERYGHGYQREQPQLGWSMSKSLTALIAGLVHWDGKLQLDESVGLPQWAGTPKAAITWRQLLNMAPGLAWDEGYGGASDATEMLFSQADQARWAADRPLTSRPGTVFTYSTGFTNVAMLGLKQRLGGTHQAIYDYYQARLFAPLGIRGGVIEPDASGTPVGGARGLLRPLDWLRLGQLVADQGQWHGQALISPDYMAFMTAASPASPAYGGSIWRQPGLPADLRARLPSDLVWFAGHMGQYVVIVPSRRLVVLRMGVAFDNKDLARHQTFSLVADLLNTP
ncbi:MAG: class A beta-lactamase-related serine hydrolase [Rubrivivax sp.]|nr:MAG: class A beta-lactamase-related serine hydrolase [Rubrivivax sp.]